MDIDNRPPGPGAPPLVETASGRHPKGRARKAQVMESITQLIASRGYENLTFDSIGRELQMRRSHVSYYFPNRQALALSAIRHVTESLMETIALRLTNVTSWEQGVAGVVRGEFDWLEQRPHHAATFGLMFQYASYNPEIRAFHTQLNAMGTELLATFLAPLFPSEGTSARVQRLARTIKEVIAGSVLEFASTNPLVSLDEQRERTVRVVFDLIDAEVRRPGLPV